MVETVLPTIEVPDWTREKFKTPTRSAKNVDMKICSSIRIFLIV